MFERLFTIRPPKLRCAVVTPVGPGHQDASIECEHSIRAAWKHDRGPFGALEVIAIDDSKGSLGRSAARNQGVAQAASAAADWIFFLDADDVMLPDAFAAVGDLVQQYDAIWGLISTLSSGDQSHHLRLPQVLSIDRIETLLVFDPFHTLQMGHFVRTSAALATPFDVNLDAGEDFDYYLRLWRSFRCVKIPRSLFVARQVGRSQGARSATAEQWGKTVRATLARERERHGLDVGSDATRAIKNAGVREMQTLYRAHGLANAENYIALSRDMPFRGSHEIELPGVAAFEMYSDNDDVVCLRHAWIGEYRMASARLWIALCKTARSIFDIGACSGFYALLAARAASPKARIYCFEPLPDNYERLQRNIGSNSIVNIEALHAVPSQRCRREQIRAFVTDGLLSSRAPDGTGRKSGSRAEYADTIGFDQFLAARNASVDVARIDVAGHESTVVAAMQAALSRQPDLLLEISPNTRLSELHASLSGYRWFAIDEDGDCINAIAERTVDAMTRSQTLWLTARDDQAIDALVAESGNRLQMD